MLTQALSQTLNAHMLPRAHHGPQCDDHASSSSDTSHAPLCSIEEFPLEDSKRLCVHLLEAAMAQLPPGSETLLGIFDLRGFGNRNADLGFVRFLVRRLCCARLLQLRSRHVAPQSFSQQPQRMS